MKHRKQITNGESDGKFELLRQMRLETTQRSIVCYGWFLLSGFTMVAVLVLILLQGLGKIVLSDKVILSLIAGTVTQATAMFATIIRRLFSK
jgi:hypothetical protein